MIQTETRHGRTYISTTDGELIHTATGRRCGRRTYLLNGESVADYHEETADIAAEYEQAAAYKARVTELIRERYDADDEMALLNNMLEENPTEAHVAEYRAYQAYRAECKERARAELQETTIEEQTSAND